MIYIDNDFRVTLISSESIIGKDIKVSYISPKSSSVITVEPTATEEETDKIHYDVPATSNTIPGFWKFWLTITTNGKKVDSTDITIKVVRHG